MPVRRARAAPLVAVLGGLVLILSMLPVATQAGGSRDATVDPVLVGAGDIAVCGVKGRDEETADLLAGIGGTVFTAGDNVYSDGTSEEFADCYDPSWGVHLARTRPSAGNHDYHVAGATAYFDYFGSAAGQAGKGYYSYDLGDWHIVVLNSNCDDVGGCDRSSPQGSWLQGDLAAHDTECTLAYWHHPLFTSGPRSGHADVRPLWSMLYEARADVIVVGHEHNYQRFAPQDASGNGDPGRGIRQFVVGTGGATLRGFERTAANSEVRDSETHGVLKLTLHPTSYDWDFVPIAGSSFADSGAASCVRVPGPLPTPTPSPAPSLAPGDATIKVVDDKSAGFRKFQLGWKRQQVGYRKRSFWTTVRKSSVRRSASWMATLDAPGRYEVLVRFPKKNATTRSAKYKVHTSDGIKTRKVSQKYKAGNWVSLGTHRFGSIAKVKLTDKTAERSASGRRIIFDVVKFVPVDVSTATNTVAVPEVSSVPTPTPTPTPSAEPEPDPESTAGPSSESSLDAGPAPTPTSSPEPSPRASLELTPDPAPTPEPKSQNLPPIADAGGAYKVDEGDTVKLDGTGSSDPDGKIVAYEWTRKQRLDDATRKRPVFSAVDDGIIEIDLTVTDDHGADDTSMAKVTVRNVDPEVAGIGSQAITLGEEFILSVPFADAGRKDTHEVAVDWGDGTTVAATVSQEAGLASATHAYADAGQYFVVVTARDDDGGIGMTRFTVAVAADPTDGPAQAE